MFKKFLSKNWIYLLLGLILLLAVVFRLRGFNDLPIDAHPMRQTDTECVAYFLAKGKSNFLNPKSCLMRPVSNTEGYFFLEMPFYEQLIAWSYQILGYSPFVARIVNLFLFLLGSITLFLFMSEWLDKKKALLSVLIFSFIPGSLFFVGHAIHPDAMAVSLVFVALFFIGRYRKNGRFLSLILSGLFLGISVASRPFALISLPFFFYFLFLKKSKIRNYLLFFLLSIIFYFYWWWRRHNLGIDMSWENWILSGQDKLLDLVMLKKLIWRNVIGETMGKVVSLLAVLGLLKLSLKKDKRIFPLLIWILAVISYWIIAPDGNLTHQYYANIYIPLIVILATFGLSWVLNKSKFIFVLILFLIIYNGVRTSSYHFNRNIEAELDIAVAEEIKREIEEDKKIIYLARSNSVPLSLAHRQGWILGEWPVDVAGHIWAFMEMRNYAFDYIVEVKSKTGEINGEDWRIIKLNYPLVKEGENINIYKYR